MATTPKPLYHGQPGNTAAVVYTVPASTTTIIRHIRILNPDTAAHTVDLYRNGSADANRITETINVAAGDSWEDDVYLPLGTGDTIEAKADTAAKVTVFIGGAEIQ